MKGFMVHTLSWDLFGLSFVVYVLLKGGLLVLILVGGPSKVRLPRRVMKPCFGSISGPLMFGNSRISCWASSWVGCNMAPVFRFIWSSAWRLMGPSN